MPIDDILSKKFKKVEAVASANWLVWERKTLNMHRAVLEWTPGGALKSYGEVSGAIRAEVAQRFKVSWWRGMGFGGVIYLHST